MNLKYNTNVIIYETETDSDIESRFVVVKGVGSRGGMPWDSGISRCKLLHIKWINNKVVLYPRELYSVSWDTP